MNYITWLVLIIVRDARNCSTWKGVISCKAVAGNLTESTHWAMQTFWKQQAKEPSIEETMLDSNAKQFKRFWKILLMLPESRHYWDGHSELSVRSELDDFPVFFQALQYCDGSRLESGWLPVLFWKTWKCQGIWQLSGNWLHELKWKVSL